MDDQALSILPLLRSNGERIMMVSKLIRPPEVPNLMRQATLSDTIRQAREAHGLSLRSLAQLIEVSPSQVMRWEAGDATPGPVYLAALAEQLELRPSRLFNLAGTPIPNDLATLPAMLRADYDLPPEAIAEIEAHIGKVARRYRSRAASTQATKPNGRREI